LIPTYLFIILAGWWLCSRLAKFVYRASLRFGYLDHPGDRKPQANPVPYGGGFVFLLGLLCWGVILLFAHGVGLLAWLFPHHSLLPRVLIHSSSAVLFGVGLVGMLCLGFLDDLWQLSPRVKLITQLLLVTWVVAMGDLRMSFFVEWSWLGYLGTILWVVLITNAFNLIDNMDGYSVIVTLVTLMVHGIILHGHGHFLMALVCCMALGPVLAFAQWNRPPAKMYLGDAGSLSLGFFVAMLSVASTYYHDGQSVISILTPLLVLAIPLFDVATVMFIRYRLKKPYFLGDHNHFSHRLLKLGLSVPQALAVIFLLTSTTGLAAIVLQHSNAWEGVCLLLQVMMILVVVLMLESREKKGS
jgi:UDP-GlcNAc:undecaprenyl-phosphate GlcNAc-1-phosphate transferase